MLVSERHNKRSPFIRAAIKHNVTTEAMYMIVHQVQANALAVRMLVEFLVKPKHLILHLVHIKALAIVSVYNLNKIIYSLCHY